MTKRSNKTNLGGHPPFVATEADRSLVLALRGAGFSHEDIAGQLRPGGVSVDTLTRHFPHELATGIAKINGIAVTNLVQAMQRGEAWAICFWMKTRMGWREKSDVNVNATVRHENSNLEDLAAELDRIAARTGAAAVPPQIN